jgi:hypothetical protein
MSSVGDLQRNAFVRLSFAIVLHYFRAVVKPSVEPIPERGLMNKRPPTLLLGRGFEYFQAVTL